MTFIDNDTRTVTEARLGAQAIETGTNGTLYFDDFESRRFSYIGTLTDPGVDDPTATNQAGWTASTYSYSATIPHAVTSVALEGGGTNSYEYDANGNMTCRIENGVTYTHAYNAENRASSIAKRTGDCATGTIIESWSFAYDGDGVRVSTAHFTGTSGSPDSTTSYFMGGQFEVKDGATKKYYSLAGMMVAVNDGTGLQYLLTDHLGSTVAVTNQSGTLTSQQRYLPFGAARTIPNSPILGTDFTYTGQRKLDDGMGGIMDYKARFYSPYINRFLQPDSIIPNPANPQSWNRYSYTFNNPIRYVDPDGHIPLLVVAVIVVAALAISACSVDQSPDDNSAILATAVHLVTSEGEHAGLGTQISDNTFITHGHYSYGDLTPDPTGEYLAELSVQNQSDVQALVGGSYGENVEGGTWEGGTTWVTTNSSLLGTAAQIASQETIASIGAGDFIDIVYWDDRREEIRVGSFEVTSQANGYIVFNNDGRINPGDSGGGIFYNGQLIGNVSTSTFMFGEIPISGSGNLIPSSVTSQTKGTRPIIKKVQAE